MVGRPRSRLFRSFWSERSGRSNLDSQWQSSHELRHQDRRRGARYNEQGWFFLVAGSRPPARSGCVGRGGATMLSLYFLSTHVHRRRKGAEQGDTSNHGVRLANLIVDNMMVLLEIMHERGVYFVLEQPCSSWMFKLPRVVRSLERIGNTNIHRVCTWMVAFGHQMPKCSHLVGTLPTLHRLRRSYCPRTTRRHAPTTTWDQTECGIRGGRDLPSSAEYTPEFCRCLFMAWQRCR